MGVSYVPVKIWSVCTNQLSSNPQELISSRGGNINVRHDDSSVTFLTIGDRNTKSNFVCKNPISFWAMLGAIALGAACVLSGPIGWIAIGVAATATIVCVVKVVTHKCTGPLNDGKWILLHSTVKINSKVAITRSSILHCNNGGLLTPFFSYAEAKKAANDICVSNVGEFAITTVADFLTGLALPTLVSSLSNTLKSFIGLGLSKEMGIAAGKLLLQYGGGYALFSVAVWGEKEIIRNTEFYGTEGNQTYDAMNEAEGNEMFSIPDPLNMDDLEDIIDIYREGKISSSNQNLAWQLEDLVGLSKQELFKSRLARDLLKQFNNGQYSDVVSQMSKYNSNRFNTTMVNEGIATAYKNILQSIGKNSVAIYSLLSPFIATLFSEVARAALAKGMANDISVSKGTNVIANTPID